MTRLRLPGAWWVRSPAFRRPFAFPAEAGTPTSAPLAPRNGRAVLSHAHLGSRKHHADRQTGSRPCRRSTGQNGTTGQGHLQPREAVFMHEMGKSGGFAPVRVGILPIVTESGLAFRAKSARIVVTYSPCLSRPAVTHIMGEFFSCDPPTACRKETVCTEEPR